MSRPEPTPAEREDPSIDEVRKRDMPGNPTGPDEPPPPPDRPTRQKIEEPAEPAV